MSALLRYSSAIQMRSVSTDITHSFVAVHLALMKISAPVTVSTVKEQNTKKVEN